MWSARRSSSIKNNKGPSTATQNKDSTEKAKAIAISNVIGQSDITSNPKAVAKAGVVWSQILTEFGSEYQATLDNALEALEGSEDMEGAMHEDESLWNWLLEIESKLDE